MSKSFHTVNEVTFWRNFTINDQVYDLSHLDAHWAEYLDERDKNNPVTYRFIITYGLHCFTKDSDTLSNEELQSFPKYEGIGKIKKVGFFVIAKNLLTNRKLPKS